MADRHDNDVMPDEVVQSAPLRHFQPAVMLLFRAADQKLRSKGSAMAWTTPILIEICIGLEINGYLPAEF